MIALTAGAKRYASQQAIAEALEALDLGGGCAVGDLISFVKDGRQHDFAIIRRRWIGEGSDITLELMLDHPARAGR